MEEAQSGASQTKVRQALTAAAPRGHSRGPRRRSLRAHLAGAWRALDPRIDLRRLRGAPRASSASEAAALAPLSVVMAGGPLSSLEAGLLMIAMESLPELDADRVEQRVTTLASGLDAQLMGITAPRSKVAIMSRFLFGDLGFRASGERDPATLEANLLLAEVLRRKEGHCLGLSCVYLTLAERLGLPIFGVVVPGHFFCRYDDGELRFDIETTLAGQARSCEDSGELYGAAGGRGYLRKLSSIEVLVEVLNNRALCRWRRGLREEAARDLERAIGATEDFARGYAGRGFMALCRGELGRAVGALGKALELDPDSARATLHLGEALLDSGELEAATRTLERAVELDATNAAARSLLARALARSGRLEEARAAHLRALSNDSQCSLSWNNYGVFLASRGELEGAANAFVQALERLDDFSPALENLARMIARGQLTELPWLFDELVQMYEERFRDQPDDRRARLCLSRFLLSSGRATERAFGLAAEADALGRDSASCELLASLALSRQELVKARLYAQAGLGLAPGARSRARLRRVLARADRAVALLRAG